MSFTQSASSLTMARTRLGAAGTGNQILFGGGISSDYSTVYSTVNIYDTRTNSWSVTNLSQARGGLAAAAAGTKVLFGGGALEDGSYTNRVDIYDTISGGWSIGSLSVARSAMAAAGAGTKIVFGGGYRGAVSNVVDIYDTVSGNWTTHTLSVARQLLAAASAGTKILFAGGKGNTLTNGGTVVDIYDTVSGNWSTATLSAGRYALAGAGAGTKILFGGGLNSVGNTDSNVVDIYDTVTGNWTQATLSVARDWLAAAAVNTTGNKKIFFGGGICDTGFVDIVDIYDTVSGGWSTAYLTEGRYYLAAAGSGNVLSFGGGTSESGASNRADTFKYPPDGSRVTYNGNGHTGGSVPIDSGVYASGATVTVLGNTGNLIRTNYTFSGWNTQDNGNGTSYTAGQTFVMGSSNVTLYAIWLDAVAPSVGTGIITPSSVTTSQVILSWDKATDTISSQANLQYLAYYSINPSLDSLLEIETNGIAVDTYAADIATKTVTGLSSGVTYYFNVIVKDEIGNKAAYTKLTQATKAIVTYNGNGHTGGSVPIDSGVYASGATVTVLGNTGNLIRTNYTFSGWNTQDNGNGTSYTAGQTFVMGSSNVTLYAIWLDAVAPSVGTGIITPSSVTTSQVILSWDKATDTISSQANLQYLAYYSINPSLDSLLEIETNGIAVDIYAADIATKTVTGLSSGVTYYFNVIVKDESGNKAAYTKLTQATEAIVPFSGYSTPVVENYYAVSKGDAGVTGVAGGIKSATVVNENYLALSGDLVVCRQGASVTLPANPVVGDWVKIVPSAINNQEAISVVVHRNGSKINSASSDVTINHTVGSYTEEVLVVYQSSSVGWFLNIP